MNLLTPVMPLLIWALKERQQHANTAASLTNLSAEWDKVWKNALNGENEAVVTVESRALQDAIYLHRERSFLIFDWVYYFLRPKNEDEMRHAAEVLVDAAEKSIREREHT